MFECRRKAKFTVDLRLELSSCLAHLEDFCRRVQVGLEAATFDQKRQLIELLIDRVVITDDQVEIRYVFPTTPGGELTRFCHLRIAYLRTICRFGTPRVFRLAIYLERAPSATRIKCLCRILQHPTTTPGLESADTNCAFA